MTRRSLASRPKSPVGISSCFQRRRVFSTSRSRSFLAKLRSGRPVLSQPFGLQVGSWQTQSPDFSIIFESSQTRKVGTLNALDPLSARCAAIFDGT